jgi:hypothetical protein
VARLQALRRTEVALVIIRRHAKITAKATGIAP